MHWHTQIQTKIQMTESVFELWSFMMSTDHWALRCTTNKAVLSLSPFQLKSNQFNANLMIIQGVQFLHIHCELSFFLLLLLLLLLSLRIVTREHKAICGHKLTTKILLLHCDRHMCITLFSCISCLFTSHDVSFVHFYCRLLESYIILQCRQDVL